MNTSKQPHQGYFGKVPMRGDFITQGLPRSFTDHWHKWIKQSLMTSEQHLGDDWMTHYLTTPIYHYVLSSGVCGEQIWLGIVMPSVDSVGRYYPMTLCRSFVTDTPPLMLVDAYSQWLAKAESLLLSTLDEHASLQRFEQEFQQLQSYIKINKQPFINPTVEKRMDTLLYDTFSLWYTKGSESIDPAIVISPSFPVNKRTAAFMDGCWKKWGWLDDQIIHS